MTFQIDRRTALAGAAALAAGAAATACVPMDQSTDGRIAAALRIIEASVRGTLGVWMLDTHNGSGTGINAGMRMPMCSTFKLSLAALLMLRGQDNTIDPQQVIRWSKAGLLPHSPFTTERADSGATLLELAHATQTLSDNTAANLLLARLGGPAGMTAFWRGNGDMVSRLDRIELDLNHVPSGSEQDTTSAMAMARTVANLVVGGPLNDSNRAMLRQWMIETQTGLKRVRAGLPAGWIAGDKTGTSGNWPDMGPVYADIGFIEVPGRAGPITFAAYLRAPMQDRMDDAAYNGALAQVGRTIAQWARSLT